MDSRRVEDEMRSGIDMQRLIAGPAKAGPYVPALVAIALSLPLAAQNAGWDAKFRAIPECEEHRRVHEAHERAAASPWLAVRQGQRGMDSLEVQGVGMGRAHRNLRRAVPDAERAPASRWSRHARSR